MAKVQSIIFDKKKWTLAKSKEWLKKNNFIVPSKGVHITNDFFRYRQITPKKDAKYRTYKFGNGIEYIIMY